ncbi:MAG TPA: TVP38/TMEM64 family protein [Syntrophomonadaceae bacterium]|nr:TVP38/TMEM64 family protein [Syntrophomonadaceae bacterium]
MHIDLTSINFTSIESTVAYLRSFGIYSPIVAFVLFFIQAVIPIIPYIILAGAAGMIFGKLSGFMLAWLGAFTGALFLYYISRWLGGNRIVCWMEKKYKFDLKNVNQKNIFWVLFISRIFPIVPTPIINVGSGLGGVSFGIFGLSSALGKLPWAIIYVLLGDYLLKSKNLINTLMFLILIIIVSIIGLYYFKKRIPINREKDKMNS